jgi:CP family cyanate transporter-like MFS transporter
MCVKTSPAPASARLPAPARSGALLVTGILVLAVNLRAAITSLPPLFPEIESALHVSAAVLAVLAAIPVLCFGVFSGAGAPLSRRFGEERVLGGALLLLAAGLVLRGISPRVLLFPGTIVAGAAIALMNVLLPSLVKRRAPGRAGLLIGLYLLMLSGGAIAGSLLAVPVFNAVAGPAGRSSGAAVQVTVAMWALPALVAAAVWLPQWRFRTLPDSSVPAVAAVPAGALSLDAPGQAGSAGQAAPGNPGRRARGGRTAAMARSALAWQVTLFMGLQSLSYYATLSWFPTMFRDRGVSAVHAGYLLALMNLGNAVTALLVPVLAQRAADQRWLAAVSVLATASGLTGAIFGPASLSAVFILLLGLGQGATLGLGVYFTMARAPDAVTAASLSAFAQGIGYLLASAGPLTIGFLHDASGSWTLPGVVLLTVAVLQLLTGWLAGRARTVPAVLAGVT